MYSFGAVIFTGFLNHVNLKIKKENKELTISNYFAINLSRILDVNKADLKKLFFNHKI